MDRRAISGPLDVARDPAGREQVEVIQAVADAMHLALGACRRSRDDGETAARRATRKGPVA